MYFFNVFVVSHVLNNVHLFVQVLKESGFTSTWSSNIKNVTYDGQATTWKRWRKYWRAAAATTLLSPVHGPA